MKLIATFAALCLAACTAAQADTITQLIVPPDVSGQLKVCGATGFDDQGYIRGMCRATTSSVCSGRGCQPVQMITTYLVAWDFTLVGVNTIAKPCKTVRHHLPQADQTTYQPGFDASSCPNLNLQGTGTVYEFEGVPYYFVASDPDTGRVLVNGQSAGYLIALSTP